MAGSSEGNKRFCDLPDAILVHILSFLPIKSLVSTSLLSRRWRYLWASTPNLELHDYDFKNDHGKIKFDHDKLMNFAERALVLRAGSSLASFSLSCSVKNDESRVNKLITSVIQHNVEQLSLDLRGCKATFFLPFCLFGCQSLVKLDLQVRICIRVPSMICLPRLKHLRLDGVRFADKESAEMLLSHPLLEELILCDCTWYNIRTVNVNSPKLQSLSVDDYLKDDWSEEGQVCFFGDNLKFFRYEGFRPPTHYSICGSTMQLREAVIFVVHQVHDMDGPRPSNRYCKLLNTLSGVQNLTLSDETIQTFDLLIHCQWVQTTLPVFYRLIRLNLKTAYDTKPLSLDSEWLTMLHERCPRLEHLNFMEVMVRNCVTEDVAMNLKKVTLHIDEPDEICCQDLINLLFNSAPVLEEVVICWIMDDDIYDQVSKVEELERELNARPKVSENCRVSVVLV